MDLRKKIRTHYYYNPYPIQSPFKNISHYNLFYEPASVSDTLEVSYLVDSKSNLEVLFVNMRGSFIADITTVNKIIMHPTINVIPEKRSPKRMAPSKAVVTGSKEYRIVAFSGLTYFIAEFWNSDVNIITNAFTLISIKNIGFTILLSEMVLDSKTSASDKKATKFVVC